MLSYKYLDSLIVRDGNIAFFIRRIFISDRLTLSYCDKYYYIWCIQVYVDRYCFSFQALWFTESQGSLGPVFGSSDRWKGLGIFFDSFDNDGQVRKIIGAPSGVML